MLKPKVNCYDGTAPRTSSEDESYPGAICRTATNARQLQDLDLEPAWSRSAPRAVSEIGKAFGAHEVGILNLSVFVRASSHEGQYQPTNRKESTWIDTQFKAAQVNLPPSPSRPPSTSLIIPNSIHTKPLLTHLQSRNPPKKLLIPAIYLNSTLLIVRQRKPLVAPRARRHRVTMSTRRWCRIQADLALDGA